MTEFKQIIGRGTRVFEGKDYFTIMDFTGATNLFYDPAWDGEQLTDDISIIDPNNKPENEEKDNDENEITASETTPPKTKIRVRLSNNKELRIVNIETRYIGDDGKPLTATQYLESLIGKLPALYHSEAQLRTARANPKTREELL